jgi:hypothetical protein
MLEIQKGEMCQRHSIFVDTPHPMLRSHLCRQATPGKDEHQQVAPLTAYCFLRSRSGHQDDSLKRMKTYGDQQATALRSQVFLRRLKSKRTSLLKANRSRVGLEAVLCRQFVIDRANSPTLTSKSLAICPRDSPSLNLLRMLSRGLSILSAIMTTATNCPKGTSVRRLNLSTP